VKERTQGKAKLHIIRDATQEGRPLVDPNVRYEAERKSQRPHHLPCACRFCFYWDFWDGINE
jgi:hypothetical protein